MASVVELAKRHIERQGQMIEYVLTSRDLAIELGEQEYAAGMADAAAGLTPGQRVRIVKEGE